MKMQATGVPRQDKSWPTTATTGVNAHEDGDKDKLEGSKDLDWYLGNRIGPTKDKIKLRAGEEFDQL